MSLIGNTNQRMGVHGPLNIPEVGSGAMEHPLLTGDTRRDRAPFPRSINGTTRSQYQCVKNGLTIGMKHIRQHVAQRKAIWANKIIVTIIKFAESCP
jgi:hypothetical protein